MVCLTALACSRSDGAGLGTPDRADADAPAPADSGHEDSEIGEDAEIGGDAEAGGDVGFTDLPRVDAGELPRQVTIGGARPTTLVVPQTYDGSPTPLVIGLHGYTSNGQDLGAYFGLAARADSRGYFFLSPDGTREAAGARNRFWNATSACCNFAGSSVDDSGYLVGLIDETSALFNIDPKRVYVAGHSNGGFMSYRLACDAADRIAAIVSLAGATHIDAANCRATEAVSVLQIHGTEDSVIRYEGGMIFRDAYPGAEQTVARWASRAGCTGGPTETGTLDLDHALAAEETDILSYSECAAGVGVQLWRINGGSHVPLFNADYGGRILDFMFAHPKP